MPQSALLEISTTQLFEEMLLSNESGSVIKTMLTSDQELTQKEAEGLLQAFLQWFSLVPQSTPEMPLQMIGSVDKVWHAFILNTALYRRFCQKYFGHFIDHDPLDPLNPDLPKEQYAKNTFMLLRETFGERLHPAWEGLAAKVTCCIGCGSN